MQNFLTTRYRQVHDKIKDVQIPDLMSKFPKGIKEIKALPLMDLLPTKISLVGSKIVQFPYNYYWRKSWPYKYWTIGLIASLPIFYQVQSMANDKFNQGKFEVLKRSVDAQRKSDGVEKEGNIPRGKE
ncbi:hypothetical protein ANTPLA_LOCUS7433 [Anthophora plagiata]